MSEEYQPVGFGGAEVKGDGAHALGVPFRQGQVGVRSLKVDGVEGGDILALEYHITLEFHLGVHDAGKAGQLQADIVVLVHHLGKKYKVWRCFCPFSFSGFFPPTTVWGTLPVQWWLKYIYFHMN